MNGRNSSRKLIWADSLWVVRNGKKEFRNLRWYVDGETIFTESVTESVNSWESPSELRNQMRKWLSDIGYCMKGVGNETISKWLLQCDGKSVEAFEGLVREKIVNHAERKAAEKQTEAEWKRLSERFGGSVLAGFGLFSEFPALVLIHFQQINHAFRDCFSRFLHAGKLFYEFVKALRINLAIRVK